MTDRRYNRQKFTPLGQVIDKVVHQYRPQMDQSLIQVWDIWQSAVGDIVAENAQPAAFKKDILLVHVSNSTWLHHLRFMEKELILKINQALGGTRVRMLKFKIGPC
jgi:predicted nucleic acid-binding Zn ribbon protein